LQPNALLPRQLRPLQLLMQPKSDFSNVSALRGARVVLGVSGGVAAYKAVEVCRRLFDAGAYVLPVLTDDALRFIGALSFSALASEPARVSMWDSPEPSPHTMLGQTADLIVIAPCTANTLAAYAHGMSDNLLTATLLATKAPVLVCPAMHTEMWEQPSVQDNLQLLRDRGVHVVYPGVGALASGDFGAGRLADPAVIVTAAAAILAPARDLAGLTVVVSAGGTREAIDPVRFIGNRSSGKQGYAVAAEAASRGATVTIVSTVKLAAPPGCVVVEVESAAEMSDAMQTYSREADVVVMAAAVADFRPINPAQQKIKKDPNSTEAPSVTLERTPDILAGLGETKPVGQTLVGFAAETQDLVANATGKLIRKKADMIVANDVSADGRGFEGDTNEVTLFTSHGAHHIDFTSKRAVARAVLDQVMVLRGSQPR
jgi:phosphopantothenoylcysteine decarboxylase / phosphopantothenate---cysteine ligase